MGCYSVLKHHEHAHEDAIWTLCWASPTDLLTGGLDTEAKIWKLSTTGGEIKLSEDRVFDGFTLGVVSIDVAPKSSIAAIVAMDSKIRLFDLDRPIESCNIKTIDAEDCYKIKFSPDGNMIATGSITGKMILYSVDVEDTPKISLDVTKFAHSLDFSPDGKMVAAGNIQGMVNVFDIATEKLVTQINAHAMPVRSVAFSPDSKFLISGSDDTQMKIHHLGQSEQVKTLSGHGSWIQDICFSPNGQHFASCSSDKKVKIWDATTHECIETFSTHSNQVTGVRYDPTGSRLASVSYDNSIVIYELLK